MKVLIVDDQQMVCEGLALLLGRDPAVSAVRTAADGFEAVNVAGTFGPDVAVVALELPGINGYEATRQLKAGGSGVAVLILAEDAEPETVAEAMRSGASGFLVKRAGASDLVEAVKALADGQTCLSDELAAPVVEQFIRGGPESVPPRHTLLSPRERQTLQMLSEGMSVKAIAFKLKLSDKTVHAFRANLMDKLGIDSVAGLTKYAVRHKLTKL